MHSIVINQTEGHPDFTIIDIVKATQHLYYRAILKMHLLPSMLLVTFVLIATVSASPIPQLQCKSPVKADEHGEPSSKLPSAWRGNRLFGFLVCPEIGSFRSSKLSAARQP
jgi:hypothetical protein